MQRSSKLGSLSREKAFLLAADVSFTHTRQMDWMLPGVPPTGRKVAIPSVVIVRFAGRKIAHEHIYWDQASVLVQLGMLTAEGLPVVGADTARMVASQNLPSNRLIAAA